MQVDEFVDRPGVPKGLDISLAPVHAAISPLEAEAARFYAGEKIKNAHAELTELATLVGSTKS